MIVPDRIRKCVAFVGYRSSTGEPRLLGSAFFVGSPYSDADPHGYLVTARHVIDAIRRRGHSTVYVRFNRVDGECEWTSMPLSAWFSIDGDPTVDVAVARSTITAELDHLFVHRTMCITDDLMGKHEVGLGDEIAVVGLFRHHHGTRRNVPIVRVGNLASMSEEKVDTALGEMDALLVEARSIGGLSGSPVFLNLGIVRMIKGQVLHSQGGAPIYFLLGLVHGHFDDTPNSTDSASDDLGLSPAQVNVGIAIVVPFRKIQETILACEAASG